MDSPGEQDVERFTVSRFTKGSPIADVECVTAADHDREVAALKELLHKYGKHMISCDVVMLPGVDQCTCGYDAALARGGQG